MEQDRGRGGARAGGRHGAPLPPGDLPRQPRVRRHVSGARDAGGQGRGRTGHVAGLQHLPGMQPLLQVPRYLHYLLGIYTVSTLSTRYLHYLSAAARPPPAVWRGWPAVTSVCSGGGTRRPPLPRLPGG